MAHVEELRQIHADINAMESIIKQSEDSRRNAQVKPTKINSPAKKDQIGQDIQISKDRIFRYPDQKYSVPNIKSKEWVSWSS